MRAKVYTKNVPNIEICDFIPAPPRTLARALSLGLFLLLVIHGSNPAGAAVTSRALDSSATLTEVADSSELLYTGVSRGGCIQQLSRMRYP